MTTNPPTEHAEQVAFIDWCNATTDYPEARWMFAIPNGGKRTITTALKLREEGVKSGVPDLFLPCPRDQYHGLWIEMKCHRRGSRVADNQALWHDYLRGVGYKVVVCRDADQAIEETMSYLGVA